MSKRGRSDAILQLKERVSKLQQERGKLYSQNSEIKSSLTPLRLQFDDKPRLGALGGDLVIIAQGLTDQPLYAHKFILASKSPVLCKMFDTNMSEKAAGVLRIDDTTLPVMRAVVKFCYHAQIEFTDEVAPESVLEVAHKYEVDVLTDVCSEELAPTINITNLPKMLKFARKYEAKGLEKTALEFFGANFDDVVCKVLDELCQPPIVSGSTWQHLRFSVREIRGGRSNETNSGLPIVSQKLFIVLLADY